MYAVVEFRNKELCVVPLLWIKENTCFWPKGNVIKAIETLKPPLPSWVTHPIIKMHFTDKCYKNAEKYMDNIIDKVSSESEGGRVELLTRKIIIEENKTMDVSSNVSSNAEYEDQDVTLTENNIEMLYNEYDPCSTPSSSNSVKHVSVEREILRKLEILGEQLSQNTLKIDHVLRSLSTNEGQILGKPENFPNFPITKRTNFKNLEHLLKHDEVASNYLKQKLSTLGGTSVRQVTTNILKYLLANKLAKKINWAGHNGKVAFKSTKLMQVVQDGVFAALGVDRPPDLNVHNIVKVIQDWLRLASQRYEYAKKKEN